MDKDSENLMINYEGDEQNNPDKKFEEPFDVKVKFLIGTTTVLKGVYMTDYIFDLKLKLMDQIHCTLPIFVYSGILLQDQLTLEDYSFKISSFLVCIPAKGRRGPLPRSFPDNRVFHNRVLGHGMEISPSPDFEHFCHTQNEIPIYTTPESPPWDIIECKTRHDRFTPIRVKFDLSKLCLECTCSGFNGFGDLIDMRRPKDGVATFRIYQVMSSKDFGRKKKEVEVKCEFLDSRKYEGYYGCQDMEKTPKLIIEKEFIPEDEDGRKYFKPLTKYLCHFVNRRGIGIRWYFVTGSDQGKEDLQDRCSYLVDKFMSFSSSTTSQDRITMFISGVSTNWKVPRFLIL